MEVLPFDTDGQSALLVVGRLTEFIRLDLSPTDGRRVIPVHKTPEQIQDDAWCEVCGSLLVPSLSQKDLASIFRRIRREIPPDTCAHLFDSRKLTQRVFAAAMGIHPRTLARALKKHPAYSVGRQTIFQEALNDASR